MLQTSQDPIAKQVLIPGNVCKKVYDDTKLMQAVREYFYFDVSTAKPNWVRLIYQ